MKLSWFEWFVLGAVCAWFAFVLITVHACKYGKPFYWSGAYYQCVAATNE